jgi:selenide,water dikinase
VADPVAGAGERALLLVGGGHAHLGLLRGLAMRPEPRLRVTLVADEVEPVYSGMLPGLVAGLYAPEECRVDLLRLATAAGARLVHDRATGLQAGARRLLCARHPPLRYDLLSLDIGSVARALPPGGGCVLPVRPIGDFPARLDAALAWLPDRRLRLAVIGGGAAGVELAFSLRHRLAATGRQAEVLLVPGGALLPRGGGLTRSVVRRALRARGIGIAEGGAVTHAGPDGVTLADGQQLGCDLALWATGAAAPAWLRETGLALDPQGFVAVDATLRSLSHPEVFAAGDVAAVLPHPRERAGVWAVRQGRPLLANIRRLLRSEAPRPHRPQRQALALIGTADGKAIALRGPLALSGTWPWRLKQWIDRRWIARFAALPAMPMSMPAPAMRCAGCGGKLPAPVLSAALRRLGVPDGPEVLVGLQAPDDAAVLRPPTGEVLLQSVDQFRAFLGDLHLFGRIAAHHALGDIHAMGGRPLAALALVTLPHGPAAWQEDDLHAMLLGAQEVLQAAGTGLVGGHSGEGAETTLGFAVTGAVDPARLLRKGGLRPGDRLVLTKPLGTGVILAAAMHGKARAAWLEGAVAAMQKPGGPVVAALAAHGATACTDVTGFGLLGHLAEMLRAGGCAASLDPAAVPLLEGAREALARGIRSTLHDGNAAAVAGLLDGTDLASPAAAALLDPQTAGGLLAGLPAAAAAAGLAALRRVGCEAALIGTVEPGPPRIRLAPGAATLPETPARIAG